MYRKNAWENYDGEERARLGAFADAYRAFLDRSKTEREAAASAERVCRAAGFQNLDDLIEAGAAGRVRGRLPRVPGRREDRARGGGRGGGDLPRGGLSQPGRADRLRRTAGPGRPGVP